MTLQQALAFGLIGLTIACFIWGRFRYDLISLAALVVAVLLGLVPAKAAFSGFSSDVVVIIACALVVSAGFARSGLIEAILRPITPKLTSAATQVPVFVAAVALLSMTTKNVGALAILMPIALQVARRTGTPPSKLLMPMSFASLLGGLVTLVGTSPNIIVSQVRQDLFGKPFGMYDFAPVGLSLTGLGVVFLCFAYRILPASRAPAETIDAALAANPYVTEVEVPPDWSAEKRRVGDLHALAEGDVSVMTLLRDGKRRSAPHANTLVRPGDKLVLEGEHQALDQLIARAKLKLTRSDRPVAMEEPTEEVRVVEVIVSPESMLTGQSAQRADLHGQHGVNLLAVSRSGYRLNQTLNSLRLRAGDVIMVQGGERTLPGALKTLGLLPLAEREVRLGGIRHALAPVAILAAAMLAIAFHLAPVAIAFFAAAVAMVALGGLRMREAYAALDGPVLVLIGALIPVGEAIHTTGGADLVAGLLSHVMGVAPPLVAMGVMMALAMISAPFMHNAPTVLVFAPIAAGVAKRLGLHADPFLMAVAVGAACDFLTPIGHQCNTLVMAPGGYRFSDYPRLGAPLSLLVLIVGPLLIAAVWPLR
ncbi:SLC13 family permease [Phenylobacterium hankyongense]|uniref:SLC13 family permease n=1 Tax=Phenylobacterium hankyongense TaxID=1813876 RepID=A0A328AYZ7_9CAUL|nr:SLC13 family permease [Phenylobacterium hankyongense]RAK59869.1 SLC13 family permease [Phenylobacterium hankyongense]